MSRHRRRLFFVCHLERSIQAQRRVEIFSHLFPLWVLTRFTHWGNNSITDNKRRLKLATDTIRLEAVTALTHRAKHLILIGAWLGKEYNVAFGQGAVNHLSALARGTGQKAADKDASKGGYLPSALFERAWPGLPVNLERLTMAEVQEFLRSHGIKLAADTVVNSDLDGVEQLEDGTLPAVIAHDEHDAALADLDDGSGLLHGGLRGEAAIVAPQVTDFGADNIYSLWRDVMQGHATNDADTRDIGNMSISVRAYQFRNNGGPVTVKLEIKNRGFECSNKLKPDTARAVARALIEAADICDAFEAAQTLREEHETARINAGPIDGLARNVVQIHPIGCAEVVFVTGVAP